MTEISVVRSDGREWTELVSGTGERPWAGAEAQVFSSGGGGFTTGFWRREPDTWEFERPYDEVALILEGEAELETPDGAVHRVGPGDVLITPKGSKGTWRITETIVKFYAIYDA